MKVLILSSHTPSLFWFRLDMMKEMISNGHDVYAVGNESEAIWGQRFIEIGIHYKSIRVSRNGINPINDLKTFSDLHKTIREIRPDLVFAYHAKTVIYGSIASNLLGIHEFYSLIAGLGSVFIGKSTKTRLVRSVMKLEYRIACGLSKKVLFHNHDDRDYFVHDHLVNLRKTAIVNGSGVNLDEFIPTGYPIKTTFLFIGRLIKDKGLIEYLKACEMIRVKFPQVRCLVVGPFDTNPSSITQAQLDPYIQSGAIEFFTEQVDIRPFIAQSSVFVLPSYREGTPKTIIEAMAMGRPIITTDAPGCRETVSNGVNGYLTNVEDAADLFEKMRLFIENPDIIEEMGQKSIEIAKMKYDVRKVNENVFKEMHLVK
ncbi:MAG: glycosyltransferase family 4 protein [Erysipelotrichaceae bacterium]